MKAPGRESFFRLAALLLLATAVMAAPARAGEGWKKTPVKPMVYWGLGGGFNVIRFMDEDELCARPSGGEFENCINVPVGGGIIVFGGIRPHPLLAVDLSWDFFLHTRSEAYSHATIQSLRLDAKVHVVPGWMVDPYVQGGGGLYWFGDEYSWTRGGGGFQLGGGFDVAWLPGFSTGLQVLYRGIYFWEREGELSRFQATYTSNIEATVNLTFRYFIL